MALTLAAAGLFADRLDHIGPRVGLPESVTGLLTALAADGPEISSALIALSRGEKRVSLGIVLGSNVFNLAAMIGASAVLAGSVRLGRRPLLIEASIAMLATLLASAVVWRLITPLVALAGLATGLVPYLALVFRGATHISERVGHFEDSRDLSPIWVPVGLALLAVALIVLGSAGMVDSALSAANRLGVSVSVIGVLVLATVTSLPNAFTAIRLGLDHRGAALVSETLNSNTINLGVGLILPGIVLGLSSSSGLVGFELTWLIGMTVVSILLLARPGGAGRLSGAGLIALYLIFLIVHVI